MNGLELELSGVSRSMPGTGTRTGSSAQSAAVLPIVRDVALCVAAGETCAIVGASGSGKTTLLGIMAGMDAPDTGRVLLHCEGRDGRDTRSLYDHDEEWRAQLRAREMGFVFQNFQLIDDMTALDNVHLAIELSQHAVKKSNATSAPHRVCDDSTGERARRWLQRVGLGERLQHFPRQLSGGEQQRVALARAFASEPAILFADEPTGSLDEQTAASMIDLLFELNRERGSTMVLVTHDAELAARCDSVYRLSQHRLQRSNAAAVHS